MICQKHAHGYIKVCLECHKESLSTPAAAAEPARESVGTLTVSMFRGHLENIDFDYTGTLPEGTYPLYAAHTPAAAAAAAEPSGLTKALQAIVLERSRQDQQWSGPAHDDGLTESDWVACIDKQQCKLMCEETKPERIRACFVKIAALAVAAIESMDRLALHTPPGDKP